MASPNIVVNLPLWVDLVAVGIGSLSGAILSRGRGHDINGVLLMAIVGGLGGGLIRDTLLQRGTPVALREGSLLVVAVGVGLAGYFFANTVAALRRLGSLPLEIMEAIFRGVYTIAGAAKALNAGLPGVACVLVGVLSGVGGSIVRDILIMQEPEILRPGTYQAAAAVFGATVFTVLVRVADVRQTPLVPICMALIVGLRLLSWKLGWQTKPARDLITDTEVGRRIVPERFHPPSPADLGPDANIDG